MSHPGTKHRTRTIMTIKGYLHPLNITARFLSIFLPLNLKKAEAKPKREHFLKNISKTYPLRLRLDRVLFLLVNSIPVGVNGLTLAAGCMSLGVLSIIQNIECNNFKVVFVFQFSLEIAKVNKSYQIWLNC